MDSESKQVVIDACATLNANEILPEEIGNLQLSSVLDDLTVEEYKSIFFLLIDYLDTDDYLNITKQETSFMIENLDKILKTINDSSIVIELLGIMKKFKKLKTLGICHHVYEKLLQKKLNRIDRVIKMFYSLCEELTDSDLEDLKRILPNNRDQIKTAEDWFYWALCKNFISKTDFSKLEEIFKYYPKCLDIIKSCVRPNAYYIRSPTINTHCGVAVILNYEFFNEKFDDREGSTVDVNSLKDVWHKFGFQTNLHNNLTASATVAKLSYYAGLDYSNYDAFVCCILSHGLSNTVIASDGKEMQIPFLISLITNNCSSLNSKPKLFFIQACQGTHIQQGFGKPIYKLSSPAARPPPTHSPTHPIAADVLLAVSSINGFISFRNKDKGSWFIEAFCKVLKQKGDKLSILDIMIEVNNLVRMNSADFGPGGPRNAQQIVNCSNTFGKVLILKKCSD